MSDEWVTCPVCLDRCCVIDHPVDRPRTKCKAMWAHCSLLCFTSCDHDSPCPDHEVTA